MEPALGAAAMRLLGRWLEEGPTVLLNAGVFPFVEALPSNHSAQSTVSMRVGSPVHTMGHCKVRCSLCSVQVLCLVEPSLGTDAGLGRWFVGVAFFC